MKTQKTPLRFSILPGFIVQGTFIALPDRFYMSEEEYIVYVVRWYRNESVSEGQFVHAFPQHVRFNKETETEPGSIQLAHTQ